MRVFTMQGEQITSPQSFVRCFSPADFLRQRELAAGFAYHRMRFLNGWINYYCAEALFHALFNAENLFQRPLLRPEDLFQTGSAAGLAMKNSPLRPDQRNRDLAALREFVPEGDCARVLESVWKLAGRAGLPDGDRQQLFVVLSCGYLLAMTTPAERPIDAREAGDAFLRRSAAERERDDWLCRPREGEIRLHAREEPYRIVLSPAAAGRPIVPRRLVARETLHGGTELPVVLQVFRGEDDPEPRTEVLWRGEYRYLNFAGGTPVCLHPVSVTNGDATLERRGNALFRAGETAPVYSGHGGIVSFAPETGGGGFVVLNADGRVDFEHYRLYEAYWENLETWERVVEVRLRGGECLLLCESGYVVSNRARGAGTAACLDAFGKELP